MAKRQSVQAAISSVLVAGGLILASSGIVASQDATEPPTSHPAFIEAGECTDLDANPVATLNELELLGSAEEGEGDEEGTRQVEGVLTASPIFTSTSEDIEFSFDDMLDSSHSVAVHLSQDDLQTYIACGEIGGVVADDELIVALHSVDDSDYDGIAILSRDDDGNVDVTIYLAGPSETELEATPAA
jgi:hypothetical protein